MTDTKNETTPALVAGSAALRRKSKLMAATAIATMLDHWMCDGYPTGNDSDEYDPATFRSEAVRFQRMADARVAKLSQPNTNASEGEKER